MNADFKDIKVGDDVFVVEQLSRYAERHNESPKTYRGEVVRVGRKYGSVKYGKYGTRCKFRLENGHSHHDSDCNARANGLGFNVYRTQSDYERELYAKDLHERLSKRLVDRFSGLVPLPLSTLEAIEQLLNEGDSE